MRYDVAGQQDTASHEKTGWHQYFMVGGIEEGSRKVGHGYAYKPDRPAKPGDYSRQYAGEANYPNARIFIIEPHAGGIVSPG